MTQKRPVVAASTPLKEMHVNMSNALIRAAHGLTLGEKRIVAACIAKLDSTKLSGGFKDGVVKLSAAEFVEAYGVDPNTAYEQLKSAGDNLFNRYVRIVQDTPKGPKETKFRWVGHVTYHEGEGWIELGFTLKIAPHLTALRKDFTSYKLAQASALRSVYSWRLIELFAQFKKTGVVRIGIEDFAHAMDVPDSYRKDFKALRVRVIEPAVAELINKDGLLVEWSATRAGRKVTGLEFNFRPDPQGRLEV